MIEKTTTRIVSRLKGAWVYLVSIVALCGAATYIAQLRLSEIPDQVIGHSAKAPELGSPREKTIDYEVSGISGSPVALTYLDESGEVRRVSTTLPWHTTLRTKRLTLPTGVIAEVTNASLLCRIRVDGEQRDEQVSTDPAAAVNCSVAVS